jgi:hypothetical protein
MDLIENVFFRQLNNIDVISCDVSLQKLDIFMCKISQKLDANLIMKYRYCNSSV